jgi:hypothetical protein
MASWETVSLTAERVVSLPSDPAAESGAAPDGTAKVNAPAQTNAATKRIFIARLLLE